MDVVGVQHEEQNYWPGLDSQVSSTKMVFHFDRSPQDCFSSSFYPQPGGTTQAPAAHQGCNHARPRLRTMGRGTKAMIRAVRACLGLKQVVQAVRYSTLTRPEGEIGGVKQQTW